MPNPYYHLVASVAYSIDKELREELEKNFLSDERDYISNLTSGIRKRWNAFGLPAFSFSQSLNRTRENIFGCDALILLRRASTATVCLFEAKFPRLSHPQRKWDSIQTSSKISHFSDQLARQAKWSHIAAIWELFILEYPSGTSPANYDPWASTCTWHSTTLFFNHALRDYTQLWSDDDLNKLVSIARKGKFQLAMGMNLYEMLMQVCKGKVGEQLPVGGGRVVMRSIDNEQTIEIPASLADLEEAVPSFLERYRINNFLYIQLDRE